ncbi:MAG: insulinase family protein [Spirochaetes bacterium]|nr:insulinase family protein [Spirochaetota bacterium]
MKKLSSYLNIKKQKNFKTFKYLFSLILLLFSFLLFSCETTYTPIKLQNLPQAKTIELPNIGKVVNYFTDYGIEVYQLYEGGKVYVDMVITNVSDYINKYPKGTVEILAYMLNLTVSGNYLVDILGTLKYNGTIDDYNFDWDDDNIYYSFVASSSNYLNAMKAGLATVLFNKPNNDSIFDTVKNFYYEKNGLFKGEENYPERYMERLPRPLFFLGHPYEKYANSFRDFKEVELNHVKALYNDLFNVNNIKFFVRGQSSQTAFKAKLEKDFAAIPQKDNKTYKLEPIKPQPQSKINYNTFYSSTAKSFYVSNYSPGPLRYSEDYYPFLVATEIFSNKTYINVRILNNLAYAVDWYVDGGKACYLKLYLTTTKLNETLKIIINTLKDLKQKGVTSDDILQVYKKRFTEFWLTMEQSSGFFSFIKYSELNYNWPERIYEHLDRIKNVKIEDVNRMYQKYFKGFIWGIVGPSQKDIDNIDKSLLFYSVE